MCYVRGLVQRWEVEIQVRFRGEGRETAKVSFVYDERDWKEDE